MIPYIYHPLLFQIGSIKVYTWGFIVAIGFLISYWVLSKLGSDSHAENLFFLSLIFGLIGSRVLYILGHLGEFFSFWDYFFVWKGGLDWSGGLFLGIFVSYIYIKTHDLEFLKYADKLIIPLVVGFLIGRFACLIGDGGHVGKETSFFLGAMVNGVTRHYTALYSILFLSLLLFVLYKLNNKQYFDGFLFSFYLISYGVFRFFMDYLRIDPVYLGLTFAQYFAILSVLLGFGFFVYGFVYGDLKYL